MASIITATTTNGLVSSADNSGVLQLSSGVGNLVTIPAVTGTAMVSGNMPLFSAYNNNSQTFASNTYAQIQPNIEDFDTAGCFNNTSSTVTLNGLSAPAWSFCPNVAGYYQITNSIAMSAVTGVLFGAIYKNGVLWANNGTLGGRYAGEGPGMLISAIVYLNGTGDYVTFYTFHTNATATTSQNNAGSKCQAFLVRTA
jgi:hypothetical protein